MRVREFEFLGVRVRNVIAGAAWQFDKVSATVWREDLTDAVKVEESRGTCWAERWRSNDSASVQSAVGETPPGVAGGVIARQQDGLFVVAAVLRDLPWTSWR